MNAISPFSVIDRPHPQGAVGLAGQRSCATGPARAQDGPPPRSCATPAGRSCGTVSTQSLASGRPLPAFAELMTRADANANGRLDLGDAASHAIAFGARAIGGLLGLDIALDAGSAPPSRTSPEPVRAAQHHPEAGSPSDVAAARLRATYAQIGAPIPPAQSFGLSRSA